MGRLPFDPSKMAGAKPAAPAHSATGAPISVSQLAVLVERALVDHLPPTINVLGEIGQFRERTHWYFDLKDDGAVVSCVMFASAARKVGFTPRIGQQVVLTGRIEYYGKQGRTQFMAERLQPVGEGALDAAYRRLCEELRSSGWFDDARKRSLPLIPRCVAVVTSRSGAALQDVLDTWKRRCPAVPIGLVDARVQGDGAADGLARAVRRLGTLRDELQLDVILLTRGGGSMEDLWCFNDRDLAEAILKSPVPIVAAIGHETDTTIAELVADLRAATPTQAAMRIFPDGSGLLRQLDSLGARLRGQMVRRIRHDRERLRGVSRHPFLVNPASMVESQADALRSHARRLLTAMRGSSRDGAARLDRLSARLERHRPSAEYARGEARLAAVNARLATAVAHSLARRQAELAGLARGLDLVGPNSVLKRGFSMTVHPDGRVVRSASDVRPGATVRTRLADGAFDSVVSGEGSTPTAPPLREVPLRSARRAAARGRGGGSDDQMDLFGPPR